MDVSRSLPLLFQNFLNTTFCHQPFLGVLVFARNFYRDVQAALQSYFGDESTSTSSLLTPATPPYRPCQAPAISHQPCVTTITGRTSGRDVSPPVSLDREPVRISARPPYRSAPSPLERHPRLSSPHLPAPSFQRPARLPRRDYVCAATEGSR